MNFLLYFLCFSLGIVAFRLWQIKEELHALVVELRARHF